MFGTTSGRRRRLLVVPFTALLATLAFAPSASAEAEQFYFFEETASSFWAVPHQCADGSTVTATLLEPVSYLKSSTSPMIDPTSKPSRSL